LDNCLALADLRASINLKAGLDNCLALADLRASINLKAGKSKQPAPSKQSKPVKKKTSKQPPSKKIHQRKRSDHLLDEEDKEDLQKPKKQSIKDQYIFQRGTLVIHKASTRPSAQPQDDISANVVHDTLSLVNASNDAETAADMEQSNNETDTEILNVVKERREEVSNTALHHDVAHRMQKLTGKDSSSSRSVPLMENRDVSNPSYMLQSLSGSDSSIQAGTTHPKIDIFSDVNEELVSSNDFRTVKLDEGQAGSDPSKTPKSLPPPELKLMEEDQARSNPRPSNVAQARPNLEPMHEDFITTVYPIVHESLKLTIEEQVNIKNPPSSSWTLSSIKNLEDAFTFGDQFINDKSTEEESGKANVETEVESMITAPIHQASSSVRPLSTPIIDLLPPKPVSLPVQEPIITVTTTTTTLPPPPPLLLQSTTDPDLAIYVFE
nr:hypothetical protein [Tanacetum cinerariifolium]